MKRCRFLLLSFLFLGIMPLAAQGPRRVVSLLPSHTEILLLLDCRDLLVGVSDVEGKDVLPDLPRVGGLKPNWEALLVLQADLILADVSHRRLEKDFKRFRLPVLYLSSTEARRIEDVFSLVREVGEIVEKEDKAGEWVRLAEQRLHVAEEKVPSGPKPGVYFEIWPKPLQSCSPDSLQGDLLRRAGARNIVPRSRRSMPLISVEWVIRQDPDVVLHTGVVSSQEVAARPGWASLSAVQRGRIYQVDRDLYSRAGPRVVEALEDLVDRLYGGGL